MIADRPQCYGLHFLVITVTDKLAKIPFLREDKAQRMNFRKPTFEHFNM
jgi:hypothetical protein